MTTRIRDNIGHIQMFLSLNSRRQGRYFRKQEKRGEDEDDYNGNDENEERGRIKNNEDEEKKEIAVIFINDFHINIESYFKIKLFNVLLN